ASSPLRVQRELAPWPAGPAGVHRAGVSSFGAGATNAHLILDSEPDSAVAIPAREQQLFVLSAKDGDALVRYARVWRSSALLTGTADPAPLAAFLRQEVAGLLDIPESAVDDREPLVDLGIDPAGLVALAQRLDTRVPGAAAAVTAEATIAAIAEGSEPAGPVPLDEICYTLQVGRVPMADRLELVVTDLAD